MYFSSNKKIHWKWPHEIEFHFQIEIKHIPVWSVNIFLAFYQWLYWIVPTNESKTTRITIHLSIALNAYLICSATPASNHIQLSVCSSSIIHLSKPIVRLYLNWAQFSVSVISTPWLDIVSNNTQRRGIRFMRLSNNEAIKIKINTQSWSGVIAAEYISMDDRSAEGEERRRRRMILERW